MSSRGGRRPINLSNPRIVAEREWLREFTRWAKGDPNLSAWEADFLAKMTHVALATDATLDWVIPTNRQAEIVSEIAGRLGYAIDAPVRMRTEYDTEASQGDC